MVDERETNSLGGRVMRYARVGRAVGGLAARVAGERYLGLKIDRSRHAGELKAALGGLKGPLMKVAQIMSTIPDVLPSEYAAELAELQSNAPPMGWPFVKRRMRSELGDGWQSKFQRFEHQAAAAASLGQVHKAVAHDGALLACKLQYPDMASVVEADLRQLRIAFSLYERYDKAISTQHIHAELSARLREELDYEREAKHIALYGAMLKGEAGVHVPVVRPELSTGRLLTMTWQEGTPLTKFADAPAETRNALAYNMFRAWYVPFYDYGIIHGDPHLGNYTARPDNTINLLDFGCIRVFPPSFVQGVIDLYAALRDDDRALAVHAYETWGFKNLSDETIDVLHLWAEFVYAPLLAEDPGGRDRRRLRRAGGGEGACRAAPPRRRRPAARVRADGSGGDRPRLGVPEAPCGDQLVRALPRPDRRLRRERARQAPGEGARGCGRAGRELAAFLLLVQVIGQRHGDAVAQRGFGNLVIRIKDDRPIALVGEIVAEDLPEGVDQMRLAVDEHRSVAVARFVPVDTDRGAAFGLRREIARLPPFERLFERAHALGLGGGLEDQRAQAEELRPHLWRIGLEDGRDRRVVERHRHAGTAAPQ